MFGRRRRWRRERRTHAVFVITVDNAVDNADDRAPDAVRESFAQQRYDRYTQDQGRAQPDGEAAQDEGAGRSEQQRRAVVGVGCAAESQPRLQPTARAAGPRADGGVERRQLEAGRPERDEVAPRGTTRGPADA
ncbi:hypothetical protein OG735_26000 [Streptomyces sp. NBC_01210]|uniref:hypothetical protein n=1 Tax=Streptomyces sp. NBC_01210 TaxID=2903774 RepID=UPI002E135E1D|nr:hypothetical protein OG735_26000 [Streptomyces sp. NBC_01210]